MQSRNPAYQITKKKYDTLHEVISEHCRPKKADEKESVVEEAAAPERYLQEDVIQGWLFKRSNTIKKWNMRYCSFDTHTGRLEWRKRMTDVEANDYIDVTFDSHIEHQDVKGHPIGFEGLGFTIHCAQKQYYFMAEDKRTFNKWCKPIEDFIKTPQVVDVTTGIANPSDARDVREAAASKVRVVITEAKELRLDKAEERGKKLLALRLKVGNDVNQSEWAQCTEARGQWNQKFVFDVNLNRIDGLELYIQAEQKAGPAQVIIGALTLPLGSFAPGEPVTFWSCLRASDQAICGKVRVSLSIEVPGAEPTSVGPLDVEAAPAKRGRGGLAGPYALLNALSCGLCFTGRGKYEPLDA